MSFDYNDKGKFFTDVISKVAVSAVIQTTQHRIEGEIYVRLEGRIKDELDLTEQFLAVTNAKVISADGKVLYEAEFMSVARNQIVWVIPDHDVAHKKDK